jgi:lysophospholipase L1-like esterase
VTAAFEHKEPFWTIDPDLSDKKMPHKEEGTSFVVNSNDDGLRTHSLSTLDSFDFRIMTMGCSTTFGWGVSDTEAYPSRLESYIHEEGYTKTAVLNAGQPGYTSFQGVWLWNRTLKNYKPDVVLIGFVVQDARKAAYSDRSQAILQKDYRFLKENFLYNSRSYLALRSTIGSVQIRAKERGSGDIGGIYRVPPADYVQNLRTLISEVKNNGGTPILFGYPLERSGYTEQHRIILQAAAEELDVLLLDPQKKMEEAVRNGQFYFSKDRGHANASGNDLIAQWVFSFLKEKKLLGKK